eukprot:scaffold10684_cov83-Isochrysis_galbana.AAC.1
MAPSCLASSSASASISTTASICPRLTRSHAATSDSISPSASLSTVRCASRACAATTTRPAPAAVARCLATSSSATPTAACAAATQPCREPRSSSTERSWAAWAAEAVSRPCAARPCTCVRRQGGGQWGLWALGSGAVPERLGWGVKGERGCCAAARAVGKGAWCGGDGVAGRRGRGRAGVNRWFFSPAALPPGLAPWPPPS